MLIQLDKVLNAHVYNLKLKEDAPNGAILEKGKYVDYDVYEAGKVANVDGEILMTVNAFLDETGLEDEDTLSFKAGKVVRGYLFSKGDAITVTIDGITGATNVANDMVGKFAIPEIGSHKLKIESAKSGSLVFEVMAVEQFGGKDALYLEVK